MIAVNDIRDLADLDKHDFETIQLYERYLESYIKKEPHPCHSAADNLSY